MTQPNARYLFLLASARPGGNSEALARHAAAALPPEAEQRWLHLRDLPLPSFEDIRHSSDGTYPEPQGHERTLLDATLWASEIVIVTPLYWYSMSASAKLYFDYWSSWLRVPSASFKQQMAAKRLWGISVDSSGEERFIQPLLGALVLSAEYMGMRWGGLLCGYGNRPGEVLADAASLSRAGAFFAEA
ncbi:NAD(P)H-dependent oxidoreductase [Chloroflexia bacterium SDU3-3]|nr:NAD(P)H-dependent oxidoreductase [Chloroflexia bacterium SDU3-3]